MRRTGSEIAMHVFVNRYQEPEINVELKHQIY